MDHPADLPAPEPPPDAFDASAPDWARPSVSDGAEPTDAFFPSGEAPAPARGALAGDGFGLPPIDFRKELNDEQYAAVTAPAQPLLVLAGAGTGKTRTLTYRVAWLLHQGVPPDRILLLTFTNKAAREMLERVEHLCGIGPRAFWGGTFHSVGQRLLRRHGEAVGLRPNYTILDPDDAEKLLTEAIREVDPQWLKKKENPKSGVLANLISYARNAQKPLAEVVAQRLAEVKDAEKIERFAKTYAAKKLAAQGADYDDLLELTLKLLQESATVRDRYQKKFLHILVDEYQDTNPLQAAIVDTLAERHRSLMAVGDDAQCIYTWRGAEVDNILTFDERHPGTEIHKIETNYRSRPDILALANQVFVTDRAGTRFDKELRSTRSRLAKPVAAACPDAKAQALMLVEKVQHLTHNEGLDLADICVLYRAHYQALDLQLELARYGIPFTITSGLKFFDQAHIRDVVAHLRILTNPDDWPAFSRVAQLLPKVGETRAQKLYRLSRDLAAERGWNLVQAMASGEVLAAVPGEARDTWQDLTATLLEMAKVTGIVGPPPGQSALALDFGQSPQGERSTPDAAPHPPAPRPLQGTTKPPAQAVQLCLEGWYSIVLRTNYADYQERAEDLNTLVGFAERFDDLTELLHQLSLLAGEMTDRTVEAPGGRLRLSTIHQAKGLEFPVVFVIGLADGLFPGRRAIDDGDLDEERRLFYVAVTRAKDQLYLLFPRVVTPAGGGAMMLPASRFLTDLPKDVYVIERPPPRRY